MPRGARDSHGGVVYHVLNRANERRRIFHKPGDFDAFVKLLIEAKQHANVDVLGYCVMPNHWHLAVLPETDLDLGRYIGWVTNTHVKRYRQHYESVGDGHVYQGRYKSFAVQDDHHFLLLMRYVEANALRAGLVSRAELWPYGSASVLAATPDLLSPWPIARLEDWLQLLNRVQPSDEIKAIRQSIRRDVPLGSEQWCRQIAPSAMCRRPPGRPRKVTATNPGATGT
jgi:putative transposase